MASAAEIKSWITDNAVRKGLPIPVTKEGIDPISKLPTVIKEKGDLSEVVYQTSDNKSESTT